MEKHLHFCKKINASENSLSGLIDMGEGKPTLYCLCTEQVGNEILEMQKQILDAKTTMCEQQLLGFSSGKYNPNDIIGLVTAMGMTKKEWEKVKKDNNLYYLTYNDLSDIENYFNKQ